MSSPYHTSSLAKMTADSSILSRNADGPKSELGNFFKVEKRGICQKKVENSIVCGLNCK